MMGRPLCCGYHGGLGSGIRSGVKRSGIQRSGKKPEGRLRRTATGPRDILPTVVSPTVSPPTVVSPTGSIPDSLRPTLTLRITQRIQDADAAEVVVDVGAVAGDVGGGDEDTGLQRPAGNCGVALRLDHRGFASGVRRGEARAGTDQVLVFHAGT